jgi:hypothetical protein
MFAIVVNATIVGDSAVGIGVIAIGAAVFGNFDGKLVLVRDALDDLIRATGINFPADLGEWAVFSHSESKPMKF